MGIDPHTQTLYPPNQKVFPTPLCITTGVGRQQSRLMCFFAHLVLVSKVRKDQSKREKVKFLMLLDQRA